MDSFFDLFASDRWQYLFAVLALGFGAYFLLDQHNKIVGGALPLDLQSLEELRITMVQVLKLSLGESPPIGHTWEELAQEIHKGSDSRELIIFLIEELSKVNIQNEVTQHALLIIMKWKFSHRPDPERPWSFSGVE